jgi:hypothetical protein
MPEFSDRYINLGDAEKDLLVQLEESITEVEALRKELIVFQDCQYKSGKWTSKIFYSI